MSKSLALIVLAGCSVPAAEAGWNESQNTTPYSCEGVVVAPQMARVESAIVKPWRELADESVTVPWLMRVLRQAKEKLPSLMTVERVRLQHHLLVIANKLDTARRTESTSTMWRTGHAQIIALIRAQAPTATELELLGDGVRPQVSAVLGPTTAIVERATQSCGSGHSVHVAKNGGLLQFRPLRSGDTQALVAQLVAFDTDGKPHVTPLVEGIEMRLGNEVSSPACVIQAADDGTLYAAAHDQVIEHRPFVQKRGEGLGCVQCHGTANSMSARDLDAFETEKVDRLRDRQVDEMATRMWSRLTATL